MDFSMMSILRRHRESMPTQNISCFRAKTQKSDRKTGLIHPFNGLIQQSPFMPKSKEFDLNLQKLIDDSRPPVLRYLVRLQRWVFDFYLVNATVWLAVTPLV